MARRMRTSQLEFTFVRADSQWARASSAFFPSRCESHKSTTSSRTGGGGVSWGATCGWTSTSGSGWRTREASSGGTRAGGSGFVIQSRRKLPSPSCSAAAGMERRAEQQEEDEDEDEGFVRLKLAVFLSGGGSNFRALHANTLSNSIYGDVVVVVSDKPACKGCDYAREHNVPVLAFPQSKKHAPEGLTAVDLVAALRKLEVDYVLLAGYLKLIPEELVRAYPRSILNIHPALLPAFGGKGYFGMKVHEAVIKSGARFSGATVHFVDEKYDSGPILAQRVVPVLADDSGHDLAARILKEEHVLYSEAVAALCEDRVLWREDGVPLIRRSWKGSAEYY
ncbi:hypothetical protein AXG93_374s1060 [Marchantia polymorpha subsp. ruderalis]|uniref:phosphoribosylglycinamide formyltransferase 1 n=1 Tax=Marchantia polymorpha subsp. ruderalis TaxID=1480154 RepID=A0A176WI94_MARPO|nr:hypothetical protein AXG93_374s1060 [Marchantia polymorpha subsp. ruderalis]